MSAEKQLPPTDPPPDSNVNYRFFMKAICVNLCFMVAFMLLIITIGIVFSLVSSTGSSGLSGLTQNQYPEPNPHHKEIKTPVRSVSVQHFEHIVQNGNQMANQIRYIVPEAQQMLQDSIRIFYEALFKVNSILLPEVPQSETLENNDLETKETTTITPSVLLSRERRAVKEMGDGDLQESETTNSCPSTTTKKVDKDTHSFIEDSYPMASDLDPLNMHFLGNPYAVEDVYNDLEEYMEIKQRIKRLERCKKSSKNPEKCDVIYNEVFSMLSNLKENIHSIQDLLGKTEIDRVKTPAFYKDSSDFKPHKDSEKIKADAPIKDPETVAASRVGFHEDMDASTGQSRQWIDSSKFINQLTNQKINNIAHANKFVPTTSLSNQLKQNDETQKSNTQSASSIANKKLATGSEFVAGSGPFLTLCDQYARNNLNPLNSNNNDQSNQNNQNQNSQQNPLNVQNQPSIIGFTSWSPQFTNRGPGSASIPMTGESMHATAKVLINPGKRLFFQKDPDQQNYK